MTLSYQLFRGFLALGLFGALAAAAALAPSAPTSHRMILIADAVAIAPAAREACALPSPPGLRLALAPGDLGRLGRRNGEDCRA